MEKKIKMSEDIEVITPEEPEVKSEALYPLFSRCKYGKLLHQDKMYNICPACGNKR